MTVTINDTAELTFDDTPAGPIQSEPWSPKLFRPTEHAAPWPWHGRVYDADDVDDTMATHVDKLVDANAHLAANLRTTQTRIVDLEEDYAALEAHILAEQRAAADRVAADQTARDRHVNQARAEAARHVDDAHRHATRIVADARALADEIIEEAQAEAAGISTTIDPADGGIVARAQAAVAHTAAVLADLDTQQSQLAQAQAILAGDPLRVEVTVMEAVAVTPARRRRASSRPAELEAAATNGADGG